MRMCATLTMQHLLQTLAMTDQIKLIQIRIPEQLHRQLKAVAASHGITLATLADTLLREGLRKLIKEKPK